MIKKIFGANVASRREKLKMERKDLARRADIAVSNLGYIENQGDHGNPSLETVQKIASALSVPAWLLFTDDYEPDNPAPVEQAHKKFVRLDNNFRSKALTYMDDLFAAQEK